MLQKKSTDTMETTNIRNILILIWFIYIQKSYIEETGFESKLEAYDKVTEFDFVSP